ncbi:aldehyde dehydrogenase family 3 member F1-like protein [Tanacetum coccineum]
MQMIWDNQFDGRIRSDPHRHVADFLEISNLFQYGENQEEAVMLRTFSFSLCEEAKIWLNELNEGTITSWNELREAFISRYFSPAKFQRLLNVIRNFHQLGQKTLVEAWIRLKEMLHTCYGHGLTKELEINALALSDRHPTYHETPSDRVKIDDPNITMKEYIRLEEEKARRCGKVYNWETATYGKIWYDEDVHDLGSVETEFPDIVFNDKLTFEEALSCEPTVSPLNDNEIDFRISFDESDEKDYTMIYDKNSFSYKIISVNDLKTDSENDNDKVNMPSFSSPEPMVSCFNDLDFFKDFEKEFPAIVYNDALFV